MGKRRIPQVQASEPIDTLIGKPIVDELDLHGLDGVEAGQRLEHFVIRLAATSPGGVVRVITGRGNRSAQGPVLQPLVGRLLDGLLKGRVQRYRLDAAGGAYLIQLAG